MIKVLAMVISNPIIERESPFMFSLPVSVQGDQVIALFAGSGAKPLFSTPKIGDVVVLEGEMIPGHHCGVDYDKVFGVVHSEFDKSTAVGRNISVHA